MTQADLLDSSARVLELEGRVGGLQRENVALQAQLKGNSQQLEELCELRGEAAGWEAQLGESEDALAQVGSECLGRPRRF